MGIKDFFLEEAEDTEEAESPDEESQFGYNEWLELNENRELPQETSSSLEKLKESKQDTRTSQQNKSDTEPVKMNRESIHRKELESNYWPFAIEKDGKSHVVGGEEVLIENATNSEGIKESYAGQWTREMFEAHEHQKEQNAWLGYTQDNVQGVQEVGIEHNSLFENLAFFGTTGHGKSTLLKNLLVQYAYKGHGFCFIDPKGDDILDLVNMLPEDRLDDIVWVEPGSEDFEKVIGFNFFGTSYEKGTPQYEKEVQEIVSDFTEILKSVQPGWGATMGALSNAISTELIKADGDYTIADMQKLMAEEEEREAFAESVGGEIGTVFIDRMANTYDESEFDPLLRRLRDWVSNPITRQIISHKKSTVNITKIVEEGKILLVKTDQIPSDKVKSLLAVSVVRRIWSSIRARSTIPEHERNPFFLVLDEFDQQSRSGMDIEKILSKGRAYKLSTCIATQQPRQLDENIREAISGNANNYFTFNPGKSLADAKDLSSKFGIEMHDLMNLGHYRLLGQFQVDKSKTDTILIDSFAPYPPRRTPEASKKILEDIVMEYGVSALSDDIAQDNYGFIANQKNNVEKVQINDDEDINVPQILESIQTAGVRYGEHKKNNKTGWVKIESIRKEMQKYTSTNIDDAILDNTLEKIPTTLLTDLGEGKNTYYRLTTEGEQEAFIQDTGKRTGGKAGHRRLLKKGYRAFTRLGYDVKLPTQDGGEQPDGIATPPIRPVEEAETIEKADALKKDLRQKYPRLYKLFSDQEISIEAESTSTTKPKQTIKNLLKAKKSGRKCVLLVKDGSQEHNTIEHYAKRVHNIFTKPRFVNKKDENGNCRYYNLSSTLKLNDDSNAIRESTKGQTVWKEQNNKIILENPEGNGAQPHAIFKNPDELNSPDSTKLPYNYNYDQKRSKYIVRDKKGNKVKEYPDKKAMLERFEPIRAPLIPENIFKNGEFPKKNDWMIVIIPDDTKEIGPQIYTPENKNSKTTPLFENDDPYNAIENKTLPKPPKTAQETVPVSDGSTPKSQKDVLKESSGTWVKPEPGDDNYDPSKDGKNYQTGHDEYYGQAGDGQQARKEDDGKMTDYKTPQEREDEALHKEWQKESNDENDDENNSKESKDYPFKEFQDKRILTRGRKNKEQDSKE